MGGGRVPVAIFERAWERWSADRDQVQRVVHLTESDAADAAALRAFADRAMEVQEIVLAVADELCWARLAPVDLRQEPGPLWLTA